VKPKSILSLPAAFLAAVLLAGCGAASEDAQAAASPYAEDTYPARSRSMPEAQSDSGVAESPARLASNVDSTPTYIHPATYGRQVIRRADLRVRVGSVEEAERRVGEIVGAAGGYVDSATSTDLASTRPVVTLTLRVPADAFDTTLAKFEALGVRLGKSISSEDVTGQLVDLDARMATMRAQEETYRELLRQSRRIEDVIQLQDKLTQVRSTIESMAAQRKSLAGLAALSTVGLTLEQDAPPTPLPTDPNWLTQAWGEAMGTVASVGRSAVVVAIWALLFSPLWLPALLLAHRAVRAAAPGRSA
jgi:hypothetical protein